LRTVALTMVADSKVSGSENLDSAGLERSQQGLWEIEAKSRVCAIAVVKFPL